MIKVYWLGGGNHTAFVLLCRLTSLSVMVSRFVCAVACARFPSFSWVCMCRPHLVYPFTWRRCVVPTFRLLCPSPCFQPFGCVPKGASARAPVSSLSGFLRPASRFSAARRFASPPAWREAPGRRSLFSFVTPGHPSRCEGACHRGLPSRFPDDCRGVTYPRVASHVLLGRSSTFSSEVAVIRSFTRFKLGSVAF